MEIPRSCITPEGKFIYGIHKPAYSVSNVRPEEKIAGLGAFKDGSTLTNAGNYPLKDIKVEQADWIFEIPNALPFRGTTYIDKEWADANAENYDRIKLPAREPVSFSSLLAQTDSDLLQKLPRPLQLALATCSTDPRDLTKLAALSCDFILNKSGEPTGLRYSRSPNNPNKPIIHDHALYEAVANNSHLPDSSIQ